MVVAKVFLCLEAVVLSVYSRELTGVVKELNHRLLQSTLTGDGINLQNGFGCI